MRAVCLLLLTLAFVAGCGTGDDEPSGTTMSASGECESVEAPDARDPEPRSAPSESLDTSKTYTLTFETSCGAFTITLDERQAPNTTASLVALAEDGYFEDTIIHRSFADS